MTKYNFEVVLGVFAPSKDYKFSNPHVLVGAFGDDFCLPSSPIGEQESSLMAVSRVLLAATGLKARTGSEGWVDLVPVPLVDAPDRTRLISEDEHGVETVARRWIAAPYGCMIPFDQFKPTPDSWTWWMPLNDALLSKFVLDHKDILISICQRV